MPKDRPSFIGNYRDHVGDDDSHYPNSKELLSHGSPIGRKLGLKAIGLHVETLAPGRRTSWPHAEESEEEFVYVLEGTPQAWVDGEIYDLVPGDLVAFPSGTGIAHTFLNNSSETVLLLVGGESKGPGENRIFYPKNRARNQECRDNGWFWEDHPVHPLGPHDGLTDHLRAHPVDSTQ